MKSLLSEQAEWGWTWVMRRESRDGTATYLQTANMARRARSFVSVRHANGNSRGTLFHGCDVTSCRYANSVTFFDFQGFSVALCICFRRLFDYLFYRTDFSREWNPFQLLHADFPAAPKYRYVWVAKWHQWSFLPFVHLRFLYIVFAARPVELIHWT